MRFESVVPVRMSLVPAYAEFFHLGLCHFDARFVLIGRSEEHTSELQSPCNLVCRLLLEKKKYLSLRSCDKMSGEGQAARPPACNRCRRGGRSWSAPPSWMMFSIPPPPTTFFFFVMTGAPVNPPLSPRAPLSL